MSQREAALRRRWDACVEVASEWYWEMDADLRFTYLSPNFAATTGIPVARVIGRRREDLADGATRESASWQGHVADLASRRPFRDFAYDGRGDDGALRHFMIGGKPVFDDDGRFGGYCGVGRDVTALQRAESRLADAIQAMGDTFVLWDAEDRLVLWNHAVEASDFAPYSALHVGLRYEDLLRARVKAGLIADAAGREEDYITERLARRRAAEPFIQRLTDGRWERVRQHRTRDGGLVVIRSDITDLKLRELALQRAEARLADAIDAMSDGFVLWDAEDRLVMWNSAAARADAGAPVHLRRGMGYVELMRARLAAGWVLDAIGREEAYLAERLTSRARADGTPIVQRLASGRWVRVSERRTREGGLVVIRTDITELKRREFELVRARDDAEAANRAKSQFLATMSHELRTPLNAIIGFSELLQHQVYGPLGSPRYVGYAADINGSGQHLLALISDVLDMSRIEAGRHELRPEPIALDDVIAETIRMVRGNAEDRGIALSVAIEPELPRLAADRRALVQILVNLLSNAVKFTDAGGRVTVSARRAADGGVALAVADNGVGIAPERLAGIYEPFQHRDASTRDARQGTGLGLSISKRLADLQGLALEIASAVGEGTTATLHFPNARVATAA